MNRYAIHICLATLLGLSTSSVAVAQPATLVVPGDRALLIIRVPSADAAVKIADFNSAQVGRDRFFYTPQLSVGQKYTYSVEALWIENGQGRRSTRSVVFQAGQSVTVDFSAPEVLNKPAPVAKQVVEKKIEEKKVVEKKVPEKKVVISKPAPKAKERTFLFTYAGKIKDLPPGKEASVWLPMAVNGPEQKIKIATQMLPKGFKIGTEKQYGNSMIFFKSKANAAGEIPFEVVYEVRRQEVVTNVAANLTLKPAASENLSRFLQPDKKVPITGKPLELIKDVKLSKDQFQAAKVLYDVVNNHMKYSKVGKGWGQGDSVWACDSKFGNCSDFHSLFISMARGNKIPSKFEMGFPIPPKHGEGVVGGYHCWAWFLPNNKGWVPVDISEANRNPDMKDYYFGNLTEDRVRFTTGRDINLEPRQKDATLNFFIYPYAEVDGRAYPAEKIERSFAYRDLP